VWNSSISIYISIYICISSIRGQVKVGGVNFNGRWMKRGYDGQSVECLR